LLLSVCREFAGAAAVYLVRMLSKLLWGGFDFIFGVYVLLDIMQM
jgi:hypothetical protein